MTLKEIERLEKSELRKRKQRLASQVKIANQRIVELEKKGYNTLELTKLQSDYALGVGNLNISKSGHLKFTTSLKNLSIEEVENLEKEVNNFLKGNTTIGGVEKLIESTKKEVKDTFVGLNGLSNKDALLLYNSSLYATLAEQYDSNTVNKKINNLMRKHDNLDINSLYNHLSKYEDKPLMEFLEDDITPQNNTSNISKGYTSINQMADDLRKGM